MPGADESIHWNEQLSRLPHWLQIVVVFTRLSITQLFIIFLLGVCVFYVAKDNGYVIDKKLMHLERLTTAVETLAEGSKKHVETTEQMQRLMCWNTSSMTDNEKRIACTK